MRSCIYITIITRNYLFYYDSIITRTGKEYCDFRVSFFHKKVPHCLDVFTLNKLEI